LVERGASVTGIERDPAAAEEARSRGLRVITGDICAIDPTELGKGFDCVIYADVLEHLANPERVIDRHMAAATRPLHVVISVPNFRHYSVFSRLFLRGDIGYEDAGIFDRTHVRITTRKLVRKWVEAFGPEQTECHYIIHRRRDRLISAVTLRTMREFLAKQVIITARFP
jgi:2-polyprenyl-3-methyl-5-hydroxy-6-metoxy-1,4-benzoquinol methylase